MATATAVDSTSTHVDDASRRNAQQSYTCLVAEDLNLENAYRAWLASRPKSVPRASRGVLERAERRLRGSIKHQEPRARLIANAERVRQAQLGCLKANDLSVALPTDVDDEGIQRRRANLAEATSVWEQMSVDRIIELYAQQLATKS